MWHRNAKAHSNSERWLSETEQSIRGLENVFKLLLSTLCKVYQ